MEEIFKYLNTRIDARSAGTILAAHTALYGNKKAKIMFLAKIVIFFVFQLFEVVRNWMWTVGGELKYIYNCYYISYHTIQKKLVKFKF